MAGEQDQPWVHVPGLEFEGWFLVYLTESFNFISLEI